MEDPYRIIYYKDVKRMLGVHRQQIEIYIEQGHLERAYIEGRKLAVGVTRESYRRFTERPVPVRIVTIPSRKRKNQV